MTLLTSRLANPVRKFLPSALRLPAKGAHEVTDLSCDDCLVFTPQMTLAIGTNWISLILHSLLCNAFRGLGLWHFVQFLS